MADKNKKNTRNPQSLLFRRLTRLLSGPLVNYRTQNNHRLRRLDMDKYANKFTSASGKDFKKTKLMSQRINFALTLMKSKKK